MQSDGSPVTCDFIGRAGGRGCTRWFPLLTAADPASGTAVARDLFVPIQGDVQSRKSDQKGIAAY